MSAILADVTDVYAFDGFSRGVFARVLIEWASAPCGNFFPVMFFGSVGTWIDLGPDPIGIPVRLSLRVIANLFVGCFGHNGTDQAGKNAPLDRPPVLNIRSYIDGLQKKLGLQKSDPYGSL